VGVIIGAKLKGIRLLPVLDAMAPGVLIAQALGRWGNWFNQELFGKPTDLPWGLKIDPEHRPEGYEDSATFHPTFLYESLWNIAAFGLVIWADRKFKLGYGRVVALYVMAYTAGRGWIEYLRVDPVQLDDVAGLRLNVWVSIVLFLLATAFFVWQGRRHPGREETAYVAGREPAADPDSSDAVTDDAVTDEADVADESDEAAQDQPESPSRDPSG
jgi:prolipoprotein diacylglyceryl transferase